VSIDGRLWRGAAIAVVVSAAIVALQHRRFSDPHVVHDRWELPAFDAYAYVAMAEHPSVFTVAPWGYRVLTPAIVHLMPGSVVRGFRDHMFLGLTAASVLLFLFLRRLGHGQRASLLATAAFAVSPAVAEVIRYPFLVEPVTVALQIAFLLAIESGRGVPTLALLATLGALSKELSLMLVPLVFFTHLPARGGRRAFYAMLGVALPALAATVLLRTYWVSHIKGPELHLGLSTLTLVAARLAESWRETALGLLLGGLTPIALLGAFSPAARPFLRRYGYLLVVTLALPLVAWINIGGPKPMAFFGPNTLRLLLFALPGLLSLALFALDRIVPHHRAPAAASDDPRPRAVEWSSAALVALTLAALVFGLDRYRRVDLRGFRDGPLVLTVARESLRTARRLENGRAVEWDPEHLRFDWGTTNPREMDRMRWFLREGWGERPHYGTGPVVMHDAQASFLVPLLAPRALDVTLTLQAPADDVVAFSVNGHRIHEAPAGVLPREVAFRIEADPLFRGDNRVTLDAKPGLTLLRIGLRPYLFGASR
jgi:hypothetical protein